MTKSIKISYRRANPKAKAQLIIVDKTILGDIWPVKRTPRRIAVNLNLDRTYFRIFDSVAEGRRWVKDVVSSYLDWRRLCAGTAIMKAHKKFMAAANER